MRCGPPRAGRRARTIAHLDWAALRSARRSNSHRLQRHHRPARRLRCQARRGHLVRADRGRPRVGAGNPTAPARLPAPGPARTPRPPHDQRRPRARRRQPGDRPTRGGTLSMLCSVAGTPDLAAPTGRWSSSRTSPRPRTASTASSRSCSPPAGSTARPAWRAAARPARAPRRRRGRPRRSAGRPRRPRRRGPAVRARAGAGGPSRSGCRRCWTPPAGWLTVLL